MMVVNERCQLVRLAPEQLSKLGTCAYRRATHRLGDGTEVVTCHVTKHPDHPMAETIGNAVLLRITMGTYRVRPRDVIHRGVVYQHWDVINWGADD